MALYVVVIGPPGAGKGTQAKKLACALGLAHVSTGDLFRDNIRDGTDLGKRVEATLSGGGLVPDELTIALVNKRLQYSDCARGAVSHELLCTVISLRKGTPSCDLNS